MAATMTSASTAAVMSPLASTTTRRTSSSSKVAMRKLKNFGGLKPESRVTRMGMAQSTEEAFAAVKSRCSGRASRAGGALATNMDAASEIFFVVPIMSALTLVGIVVGFVLLRVEAAVEESE